jgi:hypothetical protein
MLYRPSSLRKKATAFATAAAMLAGGVGTLSVTSASLSPALAGDGGGAVVTPVVAPATAPLKKLSSDDCKFFTDTAIAVMSSFPPNHFSDKFRHSIGSFTTRKFDCSGTPVLVIDKPEDDRGVLMLWKTMGDNKRGNLLDSVVVFDPKEIAPLSKVVKPERIVKALPPELASTAPASPAPRG